MEDKNLYFMNEALKLAKKAFKKDEVPIGAVIVLDGKVIAKAHNKRQKNKVATHHAEILAIEKACKKLGDWRLENAEIYVTLEPCPMCAGAIINARIKEVVFGAFDKRQGSASPDSVVNLFSLGFDQRVEVFGGIKETECKALLSEFFENKR